MIELLKTMILDFQESLPAETGVPRRLQISEVVGKATVCIGVRRAGKSTWMLQRIQHLVDSGVPVQQIALINFFDDRLHNMSSETLGTVLDAYYGLFPEYKSTAMVHFFFDEIQMVTGWEAFIDRLMRTERCEVTLTGSSANMLSKEIATQMRGRALSWELFPFSFQEYLDRAGQSSEKPWSTKKKLHLQKAFEGYWESGGFPEVTSIDRSLRIKTHQEYLLAVLFRDLVERYDIAHPRALTDLAHWLLDNVACLYSVNRLSGYLKSLGHNASRTVIADWLSWFEDAYFLFSVRLFDASVTKSNMNPKKVYCIDHAMVVSTSSGILTNRGHLLENLVFLSLRRSRENICYYRTRSGREVDFIVPRRGEKPLLVQVCDTLANPATRAREITALQEAMAETNQPHAFLVTFGEQGTETTDNGTITILPAWSFLLADS